MTWNERGGGVSTFSEYFGMYYYYDDGGPMIRCITVPGHLGAVNMI